MVNQASVVLPDRGILGHPGRAGKLFAFASVRIDIDGVCLEIHGICAIRIAPIGTK